MLQNCKIILFVILVLPRIGASKEVVPFTGDSLGCKVNITQVKKTKLAKLTCDKLKFEKEQEFLDSKFLRWGTIKNKSNKYILLFFTKGVHGERVIIFHKNKIIENITSSWPIEFSEDGIIPKLEYKKDSDSKGEFASFYYQFK